MPFVSSAQRKYLFANEPEVAKEFAAHTPKGAKLPEHVKGSKSKKKSKAYKAKLAAALQATQLIPGAPPVMRLPAAGAPQAQPQAQPAPQPPPPSKGAQRVLTTDKVQAAKKLAPTAITPSEAAVAAKMDKMASILLIKVLERNKV